MFYLKYDLWQVFTRETVTLIMSLLVGWTYGDTFWFVGGLKPYISHDLDHRFAELYLCLDGDDVRD